MDDQQKDDIEIYVNEECPPDAIYICAACGRTSKNRSGSIGSSPGWDSSCFSNSMLCHLSSVERDPDTGDIVSAELYHWPLNVLHHAVAASEDSTIADDDIRAMGIQLP